MNIVDNYVKAYNNLLKYFEIEDSVERAIEDATHLYWKEFQGNLFLAASDFDLTENPPSQIRIDEVYRQKEFTCMLTFNDEVLDAYYIILDNSKEIK